MKPHRREFEIELDSKPNLYLIGFMGTGKSSLGRLLAKRLNMRFIDADEEIEKKYSMSIKDIFDKFGEEKFREMEREFIESGHPKSSCIVSCGGGLVCRENMPELVKSKGVAVVLFASPETILKRVSGSGKRPLLNVENPLERIRELLKARMSYYLKSGVCVNADGNLRDTEDRVLRVYLERVKVKNQKRKPAK